MTFKVNFHYVGLTTPALSLHIAGKPAVSSTQYQNKETTSPRKSLPLLVP